MNSNTLEILIYSMSLFMVIMMFTVTLLVMERMKKKRDKDKSEKIDSSREYYEELLYKMQNELTENKRRWKDLNHLIVNGQEGKKLVPDTYFEYGNTSFLKNLGIDIEDIEIEKKSVFVLTPFLKEEDETFGIIKRVCNDVDLKCSRGDEIFRDNNILSHVVLSILQSNIIIANINGRNPNVFYELGISHAIGKPVILISKTMNDVPFDINGKNIIFYNKAIDLQTKLKDELLKIFINN